MDQRLRQSEIASLLKANGECSVEQLSRRFGVTGMTIRRDLQALAERDRVIRTHGGAAAAERVSFEFEFLRREESHGAAKAAIGAAAAAIVKDGQSVMLDSGTTTLAIARRLRERRNLTVITTSLPLASALQFCESIEVLLLGGALRHDAPDLTGPLTEANLEGLRADVAFVGADGIDLQGNVYNTSLAVARMLRKMTAAANRVYVAADSSKVGRTALARYGRLTDFDGLITDEGLGRAEAAALKRTKTKIITANAGKVNGNGNRDIR